MAKEIYINDLLVDLLESDNPVALTYAVNNLAELKDRQAYSTNNFNLPKTQNNLIACGLPDSSAFIGLPPYRKNTAKIVQNGIEILTNGIAIITETQEAIQVQILSGIIGFFDLLEGKSIKDLDLSDLEHDWTGDVIAASQTNTSGYIWPVIDYGDFLDTGKIVDALYQRPAMFRHTLLERIVSEAGYTMIGNILSDDRYLKSLLPFALDEFVHGDSYVIGSGNPTSAVKSVNQTLSNDDRDFDINFENYGTTNPDGWFTGIEYRPTEIAKVKVSLKYDIDVRDQFRGGSNPSIAVRIFKNVSTIAENVHQGIGDFITAEYRDQTLEAEFNVFPGDVVKITAHSEPATNRVLGVVLAGATVSFVKDVSQVIYGQAVQMEATLPDFSQTNLFKDFLQNFGLIVIPDNYNKTIRLISMSELYANKYKADDWTSKFIDQPAQTDYTFGDYGIKNYGKYKDDLNIPNQTGWGIMTLDNQTLDQKKDLFTSLYAGSISVIKLDGILVTQIKKIADGDLTKAFSIKTEPRILMDKKISGNIPGYDIISVPYFEQSGLPGLGYQSLFDAYYVEIARMLYRPFYQVRPALLKEQDIANIDWTLPIYDKVTGSYNYRNIISNFIEGEVCFVGLLKMP